MKKLIYCLFILPSVLYADKLSLFIAGGPNFTRLGNTSFVTINPLVINGYQPAKNSNWQGFWGGGVRYTVLTFLPQMQFSLGVAGYSFDLGEVKGIEYPFINAGFFDSLTYRFNVKNSLLMLESRLTYALENWQPFFLAGMGEAWNRLKNYQEVATNPAASATPLVPGFNDNTHHSFAYELGFGVGHCLFEDKTHQIQYLGSIAYRYFNLGRGQLGLLPLQSSLSHLEIKNIATQGIVFQVDVSFD